MALTHDQIMANAAEHYFGGCPRCGKSDGYLNVGRVHVFVCDEHRTAWSGGVDMFSDWHLETQADWDANARKLEDYKEVEPIHNPAAGQCTDDHRTEIANDNDDPHFHF